MADLCVIAGDLEIYCRWQKVTASPWLDFPDPRLLLLTSFMLLFVVVITASGSNNTAERTICVVIIVSHITQSPPIRDKISTSNL